MSLTVKLGLIIPLILIPVVGLFWYTLHLNVDGLIAKTTESRLESERQIIDGQFEQNELALKQVSGALSRVVLIVEAIDSKNSILFDGLLSNARLELVDEFIIAHADGTIINSFPKLPEDRISESQRELLNKGLAGEETAGLIENYDVQTATYQNHLGAVVPVINADGAVVGAILTSRTINNRFLDSINFEREDVHMAFIFNEQIVATSNFMVASLVSSSDSEVEAALQGKTSSSKSQFVEEYQRSFIYTPLDVGTDRGVIVLEVQLDQITQFEDQFLRNILFLIVFFALLAAMSISLGIHTLVLRRIRLLSRLALELAAGDYAKRVETDSFDEIGRLAISFDTMAESIHRREEKLYQLNQELENLVNERTADLQTAYDNLQAREEYLANIYSSTTDALLIIDPTTETITDANNRAIKMIGIERENLIGKTLKKLTQLDYHKISEYMQAVSAQHHVKTNQFVWRQENGISNPLEISATLTQLGGQPRIIAAVRDITDRKLAEDQLREQNNQLTLTNIELEEARLVALESGRLKTQFLATMSHELRTPLNAIIGYTEIQLTGMTGELSEEQTHYQERVLASADHLLAMINDILDISKIDSGRVEIRREAVALNELISSTIFQVNTLAETKGIALVSSIDETLPSTILGDGQRVKQVLLNLVSNAVKFTDNGQVQLRLLAKGEDRLQIDVIDTGIGISEQAIKYIFDEFRQADSSTSRRFGGTGLGLAIVRRLVALMEGTITVHSIEGQGSTFTVILPIN